MFTLPCLFICSNLPRLSRGLTGRFTAFRKVDSKEREKNQVRPHIKAFVCILSMSICLLFSLYIFFIMRFFLFSVHFCEIKKFSPFARAWFYPNWLEKCAIFPSEMEIFFFFLLSVSTNSARSFFSFSHWLTELTLLTECQFNWVVVHKTIGKNEHFVSPPKWNNERRKSLWIINACHKCFQIEDNMPHTLRIEWRNCDRVRDRKKHTQIHTRKRRNLAFLFLFGIFLF